MATMKTKALAGGAAVLLAMGGGFYALGFGELHVVNGLSTPVMVTVDGEAHRIEADARVVVGRFRVGRHELAAKREDGRELERLTATLSGSDTNVYSVLGAAPLERATFFYGPGTGQVPEPRVESACGGPSFRVFEVDFPFQEPPSSVQVSSGSTGTTSRTVLRLEPGGLPACLNSVRVEPLKLAELAARVLAVSSSAEERRYLLRYAGDAFARAGQPERTMELARPLLEDPKATREDHRVVQDLAQSAHREDEVLGRYRARYEAEKNAENAYLLARLVDLPEALSLADAALAAAPDDAWMHRIRLWAAAGLLQWADALVEADWFLSHDSEKETHGWAVQTKVRALVGLGRAGEALELLRKELDGVPRWALEDAVLVERVAARAGTPPWVEPFSRLGSPGASATERALFRYFYELSVGKTSAARPDKAGLVAFDVLDLARGEPAQALARIASMGDGQELYLSSEQAWVLLAEAWRTHNDAAAKRLARFTPTSGDGATVKRFLVEGDERALRDAQPDGRAALLLARLRALEAAGDLDGAKAMRARLEATDPLRGLAVLAADGWAHKGQPAKEEVRGLTQSGALPEAMKARPRDKK